jgi:dTDP-4-amino-4,6-dideoxygalactose transaminase
MSLLHDSPAGRRHGRANGDLLVTNDLSARLVELPMWAGLREQDQNHVVDASTRNMTFRG